MSERDLKAEINRINGALDVLGLLRERLLLQRDELGSETAREAVAEERTSAATLPPRSALPFLITIELLLIERAVLAYRYQRLSRHMPSSVDELLTLQREVLDALEEYYGAITNATRFSDAVTCSGSATSTTRCSPGPWAQAW